MDNITIPDTLTADNSSIKIEDGVIKSNIFYKPNITIIDNFFDTQTDEYCSTQGIYFGDMNNPAKVKLRIKDNKISYLKNNYLYPIIEVDNTNRHMVKIGNTSFDGYEIGIGSNETYYISVYDDVAVLNFNEISIKSDHIYFYHKNAFSSIETLGFELLKVDNTIDDISFKLKVNNFELNLTSDTIKKLRNLVDNYDLIKAQITGFTETYSLT